MNITAIAFMAKSMGSALNTPTEVLETLNKAVNKCLADPTMQSRFSDLGATPLPGSPADFGRLIAEETDKWGKVIKAGNIRLS